MDARQIQHIVFVGLDGLAVVYPVTAPVVALIEAIVPKLEEAGIIPFPPSEEMIDRMRATGKAAGEAALAASMATSAAAHAKKA